MSRMVKFDAKKFEETCSAHGINLGDAGELAGASRGYFYVCKAQGKVNNARLSKAHENIRHLPIKQNPVFTQMSLVLESSQATNEGQNQLEEDLKLVKSLGYEKICRLYRLAETAKQNGYIGG